MAGNLIKMTILFVVIYQGMQLSHASPSHLPPFEENPNPAAADETLNVAQSVESSNPSDTAESSNSPQPEETSNPSDTAESSNSPQPEEISNPSDTVETPTPTLPPTQETPNPSDTVETPDFKPTDPLELNKMAFLSLEKLYGKVGPLVYDLLTEKNALGEQMGVISKLIADRIGLDNYTEDLTLIFTNLFNPEVKEKVLGVYDQIKDIEVQGTTNRKLQDAVEIITNILNDEKAVDEIDNIIKTSLV